MKKDVSRENPGIKVIGQIVLTLSILVLLISCGANRRADGQANIENYQELQELATERNFEIDNEWALPLRGGRVNLIDNANHIRFNGDSVDVYLPYFGVRQMGGAYGRRESGIIYKGLAEDLEIIENPDNNNVVLKFRGEQGNENLQFFVTVFTNGRTNTNVTSSERDPISYRGNLGRIRGERR